MADVYIELKVDPACIVRSDNLVSWDVLDDTVQRTVKGYSALGCVTVKVISKASGIVSITVRDKVSRTMYSRNVKTERVNKCEHIPPHKKEEHAESLRQQFKSEINSKAETVKCDVVSVDTKEQRRKDDITARHNEIRAMLIKDKQKKVSVDTNMADELLIKINRKRLIEKAATHTEEYKAHQSELRKNAKVVLGGM